MAAEVGEKTPDHTLPAYDREKIFRAKQVEAPPKDRPEVEAVLEDLNRVF